jgi:hypothetical protein
MSGEDRLDRYIVRAGKLAGLPVRGIKPRLLKLSGEIADAIKPVDLNEAYLTGLLCRLRRSVALDIEKFQSQAKDVLYDPNDFSKLESELRDSGLVAGGMRLSVEHSELFDLFGSRIVPFYEIVGEMFEHGVTVVPDLIEAAAEAARCSSDMESFLSESVKPNRPEELKARIFYRIYHRPGDVYVPTADELLAVNQTLYSLAPSTSRARAAAAADLFKRLGDIHRDDNGLELTDPSFVKSIAALPRHLYAKRSTLGYVGEAAQRYHGGSASGNGSVVCVLGAGALMSAER